MRTRTLELKSGENEEGGKASARSVRENNVESTYGPQYLRAQPLNGNHRRWWSWEADPLELVGAVGCSRERHKVVLCAVNVGRGDQWVDELVEYRGGYRVQRILEEGRDEE